MKIYQIGISLILLSGLCMLYGLFQGEDNFIDLKNVFVNHLKIFHNSRKQYLLFYFFPLLLAFGISLVYILDVTMCQNIIVVVSILVSMLLAMLSIITSKDYSKCTEAQQNRITKVLNETNNAIVFCTFICILLMIISLVLIAIDGLVMDVVKIILATAVYYLLLVLLLNILLIVKRMGKLI